MSGWWTKRALTMLNLLLKTRQNSCAVNTRGGIGVENMYACDSLRGRLQGMPLTYCTMKRRSNLLSISRFQLVENVWNILPPSRLLKHNHVLPQTNGAVFQVFIVSPSSTLCMSRMFISVLPHKENKLHPTFMEPLKVMTTSMSWWKRFVSRLQTRLYLHYKRLVVSVQAAL